MSLEALVLDYGEVLVRAQRPEAVQRMAALARLREEDLRERYWRWRLDYDRGVLSDATYWQRVVDGGNIAADQLDDVVSALVAADYASWSDYRQELWDMAAQFRRGGGRTAILSNGVPGVFAGVRKDRRLADYFDAVIVSCEVGCTKPDRRIYELCLAQLGTQPASTLFVDDRLENVEGAARVGIRTLHFAGDASVEELRRLIGPVVR